MSVADGGGGKADIEDPPDTCTDEGISGVDLEYDLCAGESWPLGDSSLCLALGVTPARKHVKFRSFCPEFSPEKFYCLPAWLHPSHHF